MTTLNNQQTNNQGTTSAQQSTHANKTAQSLIQKYTVECKNKFDELSKIILKLNLCRKELREYDKQFKSTEPTISSAKISRKNSVAFDTPQYLQQRSVTSSLISLQAQKDRGPQSRSTCFGCASASIENCVTLFRALLCSNNIMQAPG